MTRQERFKANLELIIGSVYDNVRDLFFDETFSTQEVMEEIDLLKSLVLVHRLCDAYPLSKEL